MSTIQAPDPTHEAPSRWVRHDLTRARVRAVQALARARGLSGLLFADPSNLLYFTGIGGLGTLRPTWLVVPADGEPALVLARIEEDVAAASTWVDDIRVFVEWPDPSRADHWTGPLADVIHDRGIDRGTIGVEAATLTLAARDRLQAEIPHAVLVAGDDLPNELRLRKDAFELELMRVAGRVQVAQLEAVLAIARPGVAEYELALAAREGGARRAAIELGERFDLASPLIDHVQMIGAGSRGALAHGRASTARVAPGDAVQICYCGPVFLGYNLGFDRPFAFGAVSPDTQRIIDTAMRAHDAALAAIRPGVAASEVHAAACSVMEDAGLLTYRTHRTGRGVGAGESEPPELKESDSTPLEVGMTFTVEPGIYVPGVAGIRFGDTVAVTDDGYENLSLAPYHWQLDAAVR